MLRRFWIVPLFALLVAPAMARAEFKQRDWDLTVSGSGANDRDFRTFTASATAGVGYFFTDQIEVGLRPSVNISDGGSQYNWNIGVFGDYHFDLGGGWVPFIGANLGYSFGGGDFEDGWTAGPEGGVKYFINSSTYVYGIVQYEFNLNRGFDSGGFLYGLGLGVRL